MAELSPLLGTGRVGADRRIHPLWTKAMIHPVEEGKGGDTRPSSMGLHTSDVYDLLSSRPPDLCTEGCRQTPKLEFTTFSLRFKEATIFVIKIF